MAILSVTGLTVNSVALKFYDDKASQLLRYSNLLLFTSSFEFFLLDRQPGYLHVYIELFLPFSVFTAVKDA